MPNSHYHHLKDKWVQRHRDLQTNLLTKHKSSLEWLSENTKQLMVSALGGLILLSSPGKPILNNYIHHASAGQEAAVKIDKKVFMISDLGSALPDAIQPLTELQEKQVIEILSRNFDLKISAEENGIRLERNYGKIGAEQHLARYPGDNMSTHFESFEQSRMYWNSGMAPGLGAWGYFTNSASNLTQEDIDREKYYVAIQTFIAPGYNQNVRKFSQFFKYKKLLVVNPENGKSIVANIADAGPAVWTKKHLGGSPEVMHYLERVDGKQVGPVVYFFIDDPDNKVPLGPIETNE